MDLADNQRKIAAALIFSAKIFIKDGEDKWRQRWN
jgi:hypothetical protein